jgi:serine/threonine protein kinase
MIDRQIGPYPIVAPLGAGGMGEVYRARDSTLGRDVAIKILPAHHRPAVVARVHVSDTVDLRRCSSWSAARSR